MMKTQAYLPEMQRVTWAQKKIEKEKKKNKKKIKKKIDYLHF